MILRDPANTQPIADIAVTVGIPSAAQFSRMFHHHYGRVPRDLRARDQTSTDTELNRQRCGSTGPSSRRHLPWTTHAAGRP